MTNSLHTHTLPKHNQTILNLEKRILVRIPLFFRATAKNFTFVVQNEVQSYHLYNEHATVHPVVVYFQDNETVRHRSFCFISDELRHDVLWCI